MRFVVGDLLTGRKIQNLSALDGSWSEELNDSGEVECTVSLRDPVNRKLGLARSATVAKAFLAAVEDDLILQAGPIWVHDFDGDKERLTLRAAGMWSYWDSRVVLPVLAGRNPTDATTDTRFSNVVSDANAPGYPWAADTRQSLQTIAKRLVEQAQSWTNGNVPVILPAEVGGSLNERWYKGSDLGYVGDRLRQITGVDDGPDIMFTPRWTTDRLGIEWVMRIGTAAQPMLASAQRQRFNIGLAGSSVSQLKIHVDGTRMASQGFAVGGRTNGQALETISTDTALAAAGYAQLDAVDSSHSTVSETATLQGYSDELVLRGKTPSTVWSFSHDLTARPFLEAYNAGDFASVKIRNNAYEANDTHTMRLLARSGKLSEPKVSLMFAPEVVA